LHTALLGSHASWTSGSWRPGRVHGREGAGWWWRHCCCCRGRARTVSPAHPPSVLVTARPPRQRSTSGAACAELQCCRGRLAPGSILLRRPARGAPCARCGVRLMRSAWCGPSPSLKTS